MVKKISLARQWLILSFIFLLIILILFTTSISLFLELNFSRIDKESSTEYLNAKIESMMLSSYQFIQSLDTLIGSNLVDLNFTANNIENRLLNHLAVEKYVFGDVFFNKTDEIVYLDGIINADFDREKEIGFLDYFNDGRNVFDTPGLSINGDILNDFNIMGDVYLQINATLEGKLSNNGIIYVYTKNPA